MANQFHDFKVQVLGARGLSAPDDRQLYAYRITVEEFLALEALLKESLDQFGQKLRALHPGLSAVDLAAQHYTGFPALFVLYGAEWWRRRYDGRGFAWEPILHDLGVDASDWTPSRRSACVKRGLKGWGLALRDSVGLRYLGSVALQGGLPMRLLSDAKGALGRLLRCVLREAVKSQVTSIAIQAWVQSLGHYLPRTYRQKEIFVLLADVITTILDLKAQAGLSQSEGAVEELNRRIPGWRDRFPLSVEDADAQGLIEQLVKDATSEKEQLHSRLFLVERFIECDEDGSWGLRSSIPLSDEISSDALARAFDVKVDELPRFLHLSSRAADGEQSASLRKLAGQDSYRVEKNPWRFSREQAAAEHVVHLATTDGREWVVAAPRGEALDDDLPWVFDAREDPPKLLRQGGGAVATNEVLVALPPGWHPLAADSEHISSKGAMPDFNRQLFEGSGDAYFSNDEQPCHIRTGRADAFEESYEWRGTRLWQLAVSPGMAFSGKPRLYRIDDSGGMHAAAGDVNWHPLGGKSHSLAEPLGPTVMWHSAKGEVNGRARMLVLPSVAQVRLEPGDATSGSIRLVNWGAMSIRVDHPSIVFTQRRDGNDLVAELQVCDHELIPEWFIAEVHWPHSAHPARIRLPFPVRGVRIFSSSGELAPGTLQAASQLAGVRLVFFGGSPATLPHMSLKFRLVGKRNVIDRVVAPPAGSMRAEIRLQDYSTEIAHLLANDDRPDARVEVSAQIGGDTYPCLNVAHYACRLDRTEHCVLLEGGASSSITLETQEALPVLALRLDSPEDEPLNLEFVSLEDPDRGAWNFNPEGRDPGAWLIYPATDSPLVFRPTLWSVDGDDSDSEGLAGAIGISDPKRREEELNKWIAALSGDFLDSGWEHVKLIADQFGHLPLVTLDLWRKFAHSDRAMAALALRYSPIPYSFIDRFASEMSFAWEAVSFDAWKQAVNNLHHQCKLSYKDASEIVFETHLRSRLREITSHRPILRWSVFLARAAALGEQPQELHFFNSLSEEIIDQILFGADDNPWQGLMRRHAEDQWPEDFRAQVVRARQDKIFARFLRPNNEGYRDGVANLPVLLAAQALTGDNSEWFNDPSLIHKLRKHIDFDPDWFENAYNWSVARCVSAGLLKSEFVQC